MEKPTHNFDDPQVLKKAMSLFNVSPIIQRFGNWALTIYGIESLETTYAIKFSRVDESDWLNHMANKEWVKMSEFVAVLKAARVFLYYRKRCAVADKPLDVFLCHAKEDANQVKKIRLKLIGVGTKPWFDEEDLLPGQEWQREIKRQIQKSDLILICLSNNSVSKTGFVQNEMKLAVEAAQSRPEGSIYIIPTRLDDCTIPESLSKYQKVDLFTDNDFDKLCGSLELVADKIKDK